MPLNIRPLSPELEAIAIKELNEVPERREADVKHMRDWLKKQPHIRADPDDQTLISFLRGCKFSLERTKEKLDMYYTMRTALPEFFKDRSVKDKHFRELVNLKTFFPLPEPDDKGRCILVCRPGLSDPVKFPLEFYIKMNFMVLDVLIREDDQLVVNGVVNLLDLTGVALAHAVQFTPSLAKKTFVCSQDAFPIRPKGANYIHTPSLFDAIFTLIKSLTKEKIRKRLFVHGEDMAALHKQLPQHLLPEEYGGKAGTIEELNEMWMKKMDSYQEWFEADAKSGVDESKRPGKPKTQQDLFGLEGSFRQLSFD